MTFVSEADGAVFVDVLVVPRSSRDKIAGLVGERIKIQITAPPVDGEANAYLVAFVAKQLGVRKSAVSLASGETGRRKRLRIEGLDAEKVRKSFGV